MSTDKQDTMRLQASNVPSWTIEKAIPRMRELGIPLKQTALIRAAIAAFIGLDEDKIREVANPALERIGHGPTFEQYTHEAK